MPKKGYKQTEEHLRKRMKTLFKKGVSGNLKTQFKKGIKYRDNSGKNNPNWKGGISLINLRIRATKNYIKWRSNVFKRDNYHCQNCGEKGYLEVHHIIPFSILLKTFKIKTIEQAINCDYLWDVGNGVTYCQNCHKETDTHSGKLNKKIIISN